MKERKTVKYAHSFSLRQEDFGEQTPKVLMVCGEIKGFFWGGEQHTSNMWFCWEARGEPRCKYSLIRLKMAKDYSQGWKPQ